MQNTITMPMAFAAGLLSFLSPCVLPLVPAYLSYMSGVSIEELADAKGTEALRRTGLKSLLFVLGFSLVFISMGALATSVGQFLAAKMSVLMNIAGIVVFIFGLHMAGIFRIRTLYKEARIHHRFKKVGFLTAFLIGLMFALGWTPCVGPVLAMILGMAGTSNTLGQGIFLLAVYSAGLAVPFLITGFATGWALKGLSKFKRYFHTVEIASGVLLMVVGVLIFTGSLQMLNQWLPGIK